MNRTELGYNSTLYAALQVLASARSDSKTAPPAAQPPRPEASPQDNNPASARPCSPSSEYRVQISTHYSPCLELSLQACCSIIYPLVTETPREFHTRLRPRVTRGN